MKPAKSAHYFFLKETLYNKQSKQQGQEVRVGLRSKHPDLGNWVSTSQLGIQAPIIAHETMCRANPSIAPSAAKDLAMIHLSCRNMKKCLFLINAVIYDGLIWSSDYRVQDLCL